MEKITIIPVIIGTTGTVYKGIKYEIDHNILGQINNETLQRIAIMGTAYIWRRFNKTIKH